MGLLMTRMAALDDVISVSQLLSVLVSRCANRGQGTAPGCVQRAAQCSQGLDLLFGKVDGASRRLEALINAKQAIGRRLDSAQVRPPLTQSAPLSSTTTTSSTTHTRWTANESPRDSFAVQRVCVWVDDVVVFCSVK